VGFRPTETARERPIGKARAGVGSAGRARGGDVRSRRPYELSPGRLKGIAHRAGSVVALVLLDVAGVALGLYAALAVREFFVGHWPPLWGLLWQAETNWLPFLALITVLVFWQRGLYGRRERRGDFGRILSSLVLAALLAVAFAVGTGHRFSTFGVVVTAVVAAAAFVGLLRVSYESVTEAVLRLAGIRRRVLLLGRTAELAHLRGALGSSRSGIDYEFVGALGSTHGTSAFAGVLADHDVDEVIIADSDFHERELLEVVDVAHERGVEVRVAPKTTDILTKHARYIPGEAVPLFELRPPVLAGAAWVLKRVFDTVVSIVLFVAGLPVWLAIAGAIKVTSPGPVFYRDPRVGLGEREFSMFKFRTMYVDAAARQAELEVANQADGPLFKLRDDPRVTRVGAFLRRYSLDEVPQVLNVLRGEMSLVGPRPLPLRDYRRLESWHRKRYLVLPGMTGLWQVSGRSNLGFDDLVRLDFFYLDNWSIWLDVTILLKTPFAVIGRHGAY
jgi:exopolysaccharide biosynthesis polyprenyl glycosylphosphotransferase